MDFNKKINRRHTLSVKWDEPIEKNKNENLLPMWVADMDFMPPEEVSEALSTWARENVLGYPVYSEEIFDVIQRWQREKHQLEVDRAAILFSTGVVPSISIAIQALTDKGEAVMIHHPVYPPFARSVRLNDRKLVENQLVEKNGRYEIDFVQFEAQITENQVKLFVFCSPHNPGGRVWTKDEVRKIGEICKKHGVIVVSDEIHEDIVFGTHRHTTFWNAGEDFEDFSIILTSATKTFNLAGIKNSMMFIKNKEIREKIAQQALANNQHEVGTFGLIGTQAAYEKGEAWLVELLQHLEKNIDLVEKELIEKTKLSWHRPEGTYLVWIDFSAVGLTEKELNQKLIKEGEIMLNQGTSFGKHGSGFMRLNLATTEENVLEGIERIKRILD